MECLRYHHLNHCSELDRLCKIIKHNAVYIAVILTILIVHICFGNENWFLRHVILGIFITQTTGFYNYKITKSLKNHLWLKKNK